MNASARPVTVCLNAAKMSFQRQFDDTNPVHPAAYHAWALDPPRARVGAGGDGPERLNRMSVSAAMVDEPHQQLSRIAGRIAGARRDDRDAVDGQFEQR